MSASAAAQRKSHPLAYAAAGAAAEHEEAVQSAVVLLEEKKAAQQRKLAEKRALSQQLTYMLEATGELVTGALASFRSAGYVSQRAAARGAGESARLQPMPPHGALHEDTPSPTVSTGESSPVTSARAAGRELAAERAPPPDGLAAAPLDSVMNELAARRAKLMGELEA